MRCTVAIGMSFVLYGMVASQLYDMRGVQMLDVGAV